MSPLPIRRERAWVLAFSIGLILLTGLPYVAAATQPQMEFTGFIYGVEDGNSYIATMLAGANGDWLFQSPYTTHAQNGALLFLPYLLLGKLVGPNAQHGQLVLLFHVFRSLSLIALCFAAYEFLALFINRLSLRRLGLALVTLGAGLGWLLWFLGVPSFFGSISLDFYSPETFGFLANFMLPHIVLARALLLWGLHRYLRGASGGAWLDALIWFSMALFQPITAAVGLVLIAAHTAFRLASRQARRSLALKDILAFARPLIGPALGAGSILLISVWQYLTDDYLRAWAIQNQSLSPNIIHYLLAYGWMLPFVYLGARALLSKDRTKASFLLVWLTLLPLLIYAPIGLQRRLAEGAWVMLLILALNAFDKGRLAKRSRELWVFSLAVPSTLLLLFGAWQLATQPAVPVFRPPDEIAAFQGLRALAQPSDVVMASYATGSALPAWAPLHVVAGHATESVGLDKLLPRVQAFYQGRTSDDVRLEFLQQHNVAYVFWGPNEQAFGSWLPYQESYLERIVQVGEYQIYRVLADEAFD
ncbi:MAG: hypothetical protein WD751_08500 [Anaerolineales bacterium]